MLTLRIIVAPVVAACGLVGMLIGAAIAGDLPTPLDVTDQGAPAITAFTARDGLSDEIWNAIDIDGRGIAWAGSASSLARFDGYRWTATPVGSASSLVRDMHIDPDGTLWAIFEREGLARLDGDDWHLQAHRSTFLLGFWEFVDDRGARQLMLSHDRGILQWHDGAWAPAMVDDLPPGVPVRLVRTETLFGAPRLWAATSTGVWFRDLAAGAPGPWQRFADPRFVDFSSTDALRTTDRGEEELWLLSYGAGIARIRGDGVRVWRAESGELPTEALYSARVTHGRNAERQLWIASRAGLLRVRGDEVRVFDRRHGLPANAVRGIEVQRNVDGVDLLWLATEGGIARVALGHSQWQTVSLLGASENGVFGMLLEPDGHGGERLWVGTAKEGLHLLADGQWREFSRSNGALPLDNVRQIWRFPGPQGQPWRLLSVHGGLFRIDDDLRFTRIATPWDDSGDVAEFALARQHAGAWEHWFGNLRSGIHRLRDGRWAKFAADGAPPAWRVTHLGEQTDATGRSWLWAATNAGLARFDGEHWTLLPQGFGLPADGFRSVTLIAEGERSVLWAGSYRHGVIRLDISDPLQPRVLVDDGVPAAPDPTVYTVLADRHGRVYVCTNNGVQQLTPIAEGGYAARVFRRGDGLVHDECNTQSQFIDAHDRYWVGTLGGLSVYDAGIETAASHARVKPIHLTEVRVDGQRRRVAAGATLILPANTREVVVNYALMAGQRERESRYRSQLIGFDPNAGLWTPDRSRTFAALPPGRYPFQVDGRDYTGITSSASLLVIEILPSWWQRTWVHVLLALGGLLAVLIAVLAYNRNLRARQRRLRQEVALRTVELDVANQRLTELSYQDPLTGVANRRRLMEAIEAAIVRARERQLPIGVIVVDVDHFKQYNDHHGHLAGDAGLRAVAQALQSATRPQDLVARYGGEEFACLMVDADYDTTMRVAERMRALVEALPPRTLGNDEHTVTISAGALNTIPRAGEQAADLLRRADTALYNAKHNGRNRVQVAVEPGANG